jgi:hypothetical protein
MSRYLLIIVAVVSVEMGVCRMSLQAQQSSETPTPELRSSEDIPFRVLHQIASGLTYGQLKEDISIAQKEAMKKAQAAQNPVEMRISQLSGMLSQSPHRNRRFRVAIEQMRAEKENQLRAEWMKIITPEQQKTLRRRNRQAILQASLDSQRGDRSLLDHQESIDQLMTNEDLLSVVERPAIQDLLEITDEQFSQVEDLRRAAQTDAMTVLLKASERAKRSSESPAAPVPQSDAWGRLNERTMKVLNAEQTAAYRELCSNPTRQIKLLSSGNANDIKAGFRMMLQHGATRDIRTEVKDGQVTTTVVLHNAFESPELVKELKLSDAQQKDIALILNELRPEIVAGIEASQKAYHDGESKKRTAFDELLMAHNQQFHTKVVTLLTAAQSSALEKERLRGLGLSALKRPPVVAALNLTEEQSKAVDDILSQRGPTMEMPMMTHSSSPEEFQKQAEEFHKRARENGEKFRAFQQKQSEELHALLNEEQRKEFSRMTGYVFQKAAGKTDPVISL